MRLNFRAFTHAQDLNYSSTSKEEVSLLAHKLMKFHAQLLSLHELKQKCQTGELMIKGFKVDRVACEIDGAIH